MSLLVTSWSDRAFLIASVSVVTYVYNCVFAVTTHIHLRLDVSMCVIKLANGRLLLELSSVSVSPCTPLSDLACHLHIPVRPSESVLGPCSLRC